MITYRLMQADAIHPNPEIARHLSRIYKLSRKDIDLNLTRSPYIELLEALGKPHLNLPPVIHVAGTNGKGSTIAMLRSILEQAGYAVHVYTSPHLIRFNERVRLAGHLISDQQLLHYIDLLDSTGITALTFFEYTTALAFKAFSEHKADLVLLEVGMGGRLDCTNVITESLASIITKIGMDHMEFLGDTAEKIAAEKAGIIKQGGTVILAPQTEQSVIETVQKIANQKSATFIPCKAVCMDSSLRGPHQKENIGAVLAVLEHITGIFPVTQSHIHNGLMTTEWPARLQNITEQISMPHGFEIWLDGGHNPDAAQALAMQIKAWNKAGDKPVCMILGMQAGKDAAGFVAPVAPYLNGHIWCIDNLAGNHPQAAAALATSIQTPCYTAPDYRSALTEIEKKMNSAHILICGSLYLAGQVLADLEDKPKS